jgi:hypothetical protein
VFAKDTAGNVVGSRPLTARIDNTAPTRVDVAAAGGEQWRNHNDFALSWVNAPENDRAPIASVVYKLCPAAGGGACRQAELKGDGIASLPVQVPGSGAWTVSGSEHVVGPDDAALRRRGATTRIRTLAGRRPDARVRAGDRQGVRARGRVD